MGPVFASHRFLLYIRHACMTLSLVVLQQSGGEYASHQAQQSTDFFTAGIKATVGTVLEVRTLPSAALAHA